MRWTYDITGAEPIIRDYRVYDAGALVAGQLMQLGTTDPDSGADQGLALVTAYNATAANTATNALGILLEAVASPGNPITAPSYAKVIINPGAVYRVEHSLAAADDAAITSTSTTTVTVPSLADDSDGYWVYFPTATAGVKGSLRLLTAGASGSATMDSALTVAGTGADTAVLISPELKTAPNLTSAGTIVSSGALTALGGAAKLRILHSYIDRDAGLEILQAGVHEGIDDLDKVKQGLGPKFYYDIVMIDHALRT